VKIVAEILNTSIGKSIVKITPGISLLDKVAGLEGQQKLHNMEHWDLNLRVFNHSMFLLGDQNTLLEEVRVNGQTVLAGDQHRELR
jgi:hypothetical protein